MTALKQNIANCQLYIIDQCIKVYKFVDYLHDKRIKVKLKNILAQPQRNVLTAILYKTKADYLRYIYECLSGDDGLLVTKDFEIFNTPETFDDDLEK